MAPRNWNGVNSNLASLLGPNSDFRGKWNAAEVLRICCCGSLEPWQSRNTMLPVEAHTLTRIKTNQLCCRTRAETQCTRIWWNLGVRKAQLTQCTRAEKQTMS